MAKASTKANVTLSLTDKMSGAVKNISKKLKGLGVASGAAGAAISASLGAAALTFAKTGDQLDKMRSKTGFSAQSLSELAFAAGQGGASLESVDKALQGMARMSVDAGRGLSTATDNLKELGISQADFQSASPEKQFEMLTTALSKVSDPTKKAGLAMKVFGRAGRDMLPLLNEGPEGIAALREEANALGITMGEEAASSAAALTDAMGRLQAQLKYVVVQVGAALAPALVKISTFITPIIAKVIEFVKNNKFLIITIAAVGAGLVALGGILVAAAVAMTAISAIAGIIFNPMVIGIGLAAAAIAGLIAYFVDFEAILTPIKALSDDLWSSMTRGWEGITAAVSSGDFGLAFEIAMKSAEIALFESLDRLWGGWRDFTSKVVDIVRNVIKTIQGLWSKGVDWIADKIIRVGMAVGLIDEATGKQMLIESANIGQERTERIQANTDSFADGILTELKKDRAELDAELDNLVTKAIENAPEPEPVEPPPVVPEVEVKTPPQGLLTASGSTGGFSAASVVSQLGKDTEKIQKDQLTALNSINDNIENLQPADGGFAA